jgi:hypothetical protein
MELLNIVQRYTPKEVFKTAFTYHEDCGKNPFTIGLRHGINQVCIACKSGSVHSDGTIAGHVERILNSADLMPWSDFYKTKEFAAYKCHTCGYQWSWYKNE